MPSFNLDYEIYTVAEGDALWKTAATRLGSGAKHHEVKALNGMTSNILVFGQELKVPK